MDFVGMPGRALVVRLSSGINTDSKEGRKYGSQDRLHDMPQTAQETAANQAITLAMVESFDEDSRLLLQAIDKITKGLRYLNAGLSHFSGVRFNFGPHPRVA